ncbi:hypothetical protein RRG08_025624 [Elysia crispata]|uniref:Uncharacterized protein n=1 Tax=Elysia crispata TaxID=231223 RepID=A0AAE0YEE5_9GAST|nr:hypothetical protein RRG08_025624 [Elysia crispata]
MLTRSGVRLPEDLAGERPGATGRRPAHLQITERTFLVPHSGTVDCAKHEGLDSSAIREKSLSIWRVRENPLHYLSSWLAVCSGYLRNSLIFAAVYQQVSLHCDPSLASLLEQEIAGKTRRAHPWKPWHLGALNFVGIRR